MTMTPALDREQTTEARQRLAVAAGAALLVAGLVLVMFVLPAEYAVDPLWGRRAVAACSTWASSDSRSTR